MVVRVWDTRALLPLMDVPAHVLPSTSLSTDIPVVRLKLMQRLMTDCREHGTCARVGPCTSRCTLPEVDIITL